MAITLISAIEILVCGGVAAACGVVVGARVMSTRSTAVRANEESATSIRRLRTIEHDLRNLSSALVTGLAYTRSLDPAEMPEVFVDLEDAARALHGLASTLTAGSSSRAGSTESVVRVVTSLVRCTGVAVDLDVDGDLAFWGDDVDAMRIVQNLMFNAARESRQLPDARVSVRIRGDELRITNALATATTLDDSIYDEGVSARGSSGLGLPSAREAAERLGWRLRHEVHANLVTFVVSPNGNAVSQKRELEGVT